MAKCKHCGKPLYQNAQGEWEHERREKPDEHGGRRASLSNDGGDSNANAAADAEAKAKADAEAKAAAEAEAKAKADQETAPDRGHPLSRRIGGKQE